MKKVLIISLLIIAMITPVLAQNQSNNSSGITSLLQEEWNFDYCQSVDESVDSGDCQKEEISIKPYSLLFNGLVIFLAVGIGLKFYRVYIKGEPF